MQLESGGMSPANPPTGMGPRAGTCHAEDVPRPQLGETGKKLRTRSMLPSGLRQPRREMWLHVFSQSLSFVGQLSLGCVCEESLRALESI